MVSRFWNGVQQGGVWHGCVCTENRTDDEATVRLAGRGRSSTVCRHRVHKAGSWWGRVHLERASVRSQDHPPRTGGVGSNRGSGHESCPKKGGWTEKTSRDICGPRSELLQGARGPHRWRSDAGRGEMDELVSEADFASARQIGHSGQSTGRFPIATQERIPQAESPEEKDDGPPQSKPQRPVQKDRPPQEAVFEGWPARHQHGYEEEGIARRFLP